VVVDFRVVIFEFPAAEAFGADRAPPQTGFGTSVAFDFGAEVVEDKVFVNFVRASWDCVGSVRVDQ